RIALLGARPEHADGGDGYIAPGRALGGDAETFAVLGVRGKTPSGDGARGVRPGALWNSPVMVGRLRPGLGAARRGRPAAFGPPRAVRPAASAPRADTCLAPAALAAVYDGLPSWNFSQGFLSRIPEHLAVTRADDLGWSDWGTPEAIERSLSALGLVPPWRQY